MGRNKATYNKYLWLKKFEEITENNEFAFAVNHWHDSEFWFKHFKRLQDFEAKLTIVDSETIRIIWPRAQYKIIDILRYLYTEMPYPSSADKLKNNEGLEICWS